MVCLIDQLQRDKYIEVYLRSIREKTNLITNNGGVPRFSMYFSPNRTNVQKIKSDDQGFGLLLDWIISSWDKSKNEINYKNETLIIEFLDKAKTHIRVSYKDKCEFIECSNVESLLGKISSLSRAHSNQNLYYRGQASHYQWIPSLYREPAWVENEAALNAKVISRHVEDFQDCHTTIEKLIKLKHFNQPSRLYDIVANPLMALFFACESGIRDKSDGMIAIIYSDPSNEKYSVLSDTVIELSSLSNVSRFQQLNKHCIHINNTCRKKDSDKCSCLQCCSQPAKMLQERSFVCEECEENYNGCGVSIFLSELAHQCKKESGIESYWDDVTLEKIDQCIVVHPELNNARIIQQQGLFILCGLNSKNPYEPPVSLYTFFGDDNNAKRTFLYIPNDSLHKCNTELIRLGINRSQVYFDLEKTIEFEKEKFKEEYSLHM